MTTRDALEPLYELASAAAKEEAQHASDGEGVAAAARTESGADLVGVWIDAMVDSACLCAETGPICEAHRTKDPIVASICVRWTESAGSVVLPACGVCQERLATFSTDVLVAVGRANDVTDFRTLTELRPAPWWDAIEAD